MSGRKDCAAEHKSVWLEEKKIFLAISTEVTPSDGKKYIYLIITIMKH